MDRVQEICQNLFIKQIESRTEYDEDVKPYVQTVYVESQCPFRPATERSASFSGRSMVRSLRN